jgi:YD repeat-containing protein
MMWKKYTWAFVLLLGPLLSLQGFAQLTLGWEYNYNGKCIDWGVWPDEPACKLHGFDGINFWGLCGKYIDPNNPLTGISDERDCRTGACASIRQCMLTFQAWVPPAVNPPRACAGNPIDINNGTKIQSEEDVYPLAPGQVAFNRYYRAPTSAATLPWRHSFDKTLTLSNPTLIDAKYKGDTYYYQDTACEAGWSYMKASMTEPWAKNTTALFRDGQCKIMRNNKTIRTIRVSALFRDVPYPAYTDVDNTVHSEVALLSRPDGSVLTLIPTSTTRFQLNNGDSGFLQKVASNGVMWRYTSGDTVEEYSDKGKLLSITAVNGMKQTLTYDGVTGLLANVQDATGRKIVFAYSANQLESITTDGNKTTRYAYNALGLITDVQRPDNTHRLYHYEDTRFPTYLTGITDESGARFATWTYDAQGRAISSEHAGGADKTQLSFNADGSTTVTNALLKKTIYRFDDIAGDRRVVKVEGQPTANCAGANQNYTYTPEGWVESKTDWNGNKTTYQYNSKGQETSRTEAFGTVSAKTTKTEWHPTLNRQTKVTEPDRETLYNYSDTGQLLNQTSRSLP